MKYLKLESIKKHLVIEHDEDDEYLAELGESVEEAMPKFLGQPLENLTDEDGKLPADLYRGMILFISKLYSQREPEVGYKLYDTGAIRLLIGHYIKYV